MFSLRLKDNYLDIRIETKLSPFDYREYQDFMRSLPGSYYVDAEYKWMVPKKHIDIFIERYENDTACFNTIEEIKGIEEILLPEFPLLDDFSDFLLEPYDFQKQGISFLTHVGSGIIGDDMGLGKTIQTAGAGHFLYKQGKAKKNIGDLSG